MSAQISYDLAMIDDMDFVEGTYRLENGTWCVFIILSKQHHRDMLQINVERHVWDSGTSGLVISVPLHTRLNMDTVEHILSDALNVDEWERIRGPDSMQLR